MAIYSYLSIDYPSASLTSARGINSLGQVVGNYLDSNGNIDGFFYDAGTFTKITYPGSNEVELTGINTSGQIVGNDLDGADHSQGFIYSNGAFTPISFPGATSTEPRGINDAGQVVGQWYQSSTIFGSFLYSDGTYTSVQSPSVPADATNNGTEADSINDLGQIAGSYANGNAPGYYGTTPGFIDTDGTYSYFTYPGAYGTDSSYINDAGEVAGVYAPTSDSYDASYIYSNGMFSPFAYPGATVTQIQGLNDAGEIVGVYLDSAGGYHGFVATPSATCFCPGTLILTARGEVAVEALAAGDVVLTAAGERRPVRWIGQRRYDGRFVGTNHLVLPIHVRAGALGPDLPRRDLHVSPGHGLFVEGVLVPAWRLVNGVSITQAEQVEEVSYLHVELDSHELILAEGAAVESYLDIGDRAQFHNAAEFHALYPDHVPGAAVSCVPRVEEGLHLQAIQHRLLWRAGVGPAYPGAPGVLRGYVDQAGPDVVCGWAQDAGAPEWPVLLDVWVGGAWACSVLANGYRADLRQAGLGSGCHAFTVTLPAGTTGAVEVRRSADGAPLAHTEAAEWQPQAA